MWSQLAHENNEYFTPRKLPAIYGGFKCKVYNWGERSEPYRSDVGRQFLCMYVCMYVCNGTFVGLIAGFYTRGPYQFRVFLVYFAQLEA